MDSPWGFKRLEQDLATKRHHHDLSDLVLDPGDITNRRGKMPELTELKFFQRERDNRLVNSTVCSMTWTNGYIITPYNLIFLIKISQNIGSIRKKISDFE